MSLSTIANSTYSAVGAGLGAWVGLAKSIRVATRGGQPYPPLSPNGTFIDYSNARSYYQVELINKGATILLAILIISLVWTFLGSLSQCICLCCCYKSIKRKRYRQSTFSQRNCSYAWIIVIYLVFAIGALTSFTGGGILDTSITSLKVGVVGSLKSAVGIVDALTPAISSTFDGIQVIIGTAIESTTKAINFDSLVDQNITSNLEILALSFQQTQGNITAVLATSRVVRTSRNSLVTSISSIATDVSIISTSISSWSVPGSPLNVPSPGIGTYYLTNSIPINGIDGTILSVQQGVNNAPDGATQLSPLASMPDLNAFAIQIEGVINTLNVTVRQQIQSAGTGVKDKVYPALASAKKSILDSVGTLQISLDTSINPLTISAESNFQTAQKYTVYRGYTMIILSSIILLIIISQSFFVTKKMGRAIKGCNLCTTPFYILIQLLAIILFIFALLVGDFCSATFEYSPPPIKQAFNNEMAATISQVFDARDQCVANQSLIQIASNLNLVNASQVDVKKLASDQINSVDFGGISSGFNVTTVLSLSDTPAGQLNSLSGLDITGLNTTSLDGLSSALSSLDTQMSNLRTSLISFSAGLGFSQLTFNPTVSTTDTRTAAVNDLRSRVAAVVSIIDGLRPNGKISTAGQDTLSFTNSITNLKITAQKLKVLLSKKTVALTIPAYYDTAITGIIKFGTDASQNVLEFNQLTIVIPTVKTYIVNQIGLEQDNLNLALNCTALGHNLIIAQDAVCGQLLSGFDALWLAYAFIGVMAAISMPVWIYVANRLCVAEYAVDIENQPIKSVKTSRAKNNILQTFPDEDEFSNKRAINITIN